METTKSSMISCFLLEKFAPQQTKNPEKPCICKGFRDFLRICLFVAGETAKKKTDAPQRVGFGCIENNS